LQAAYSTITSAVADYRANEFFKEFNNAGVTFSDIAIYYRTSA